MRDYLIILFLSFGLSGYCQLDFETINIRSSSVYGISFPLTKNMTLQEASRKNKLLITDNHKSETIKTFMCFVDSVGYIVTKYLVNGIVEDEETIFFKILLINTLVDVDELIVVIAFKDRGVKKNYIFILDYYEDSGCYQFVILEPDYENKLWVGRTLLEPEIEHNKIFFE